MNTFQIYLMLLCGLQGKARRRSVDMVVKGVRSRATRVRTSMISRAASRSVTRMYFEAFVLAVKGGMNLEELQQQGPVRFMFEHEACGRCGTHLSSKTFRKPVINHREPEK